MCVCVCVCVCAVQELAEEAGDSETVAVLNQELSELEEKAEQLDKQRSKGLSAIRSATTASGPLLVDSATHTTHTHC